MSRLQATSRVSTSSLPALRLSPGTTTFPHKIANVSGVMELTSHFRADSLRLSNGGSVTTWGNEANAADFATKNTSSPTLVYNQKNGYPVVRFPGSLGYFFATARTISVATLFAVIKSSEATFTTYRGIIGGSANLANDEGMHAANATTLIDISASGSYKAYIDGATTSNADLVTPANWHIAIMTLEAAHTYATLQIGRDRTTASRVWYGDIAECGTYNTILSAANLAKLFAYLNNKYKVY